MIAGVTLDGKIHFRQFAALDIHYILLEFYINAHEQNIWGCTSWLYRLDVEPRIRVQSAAKTGALMLSLSW